jgi:hypothetical protein
MHAPSAVALPAVFLLAATAVAAPPDVPVRELLPPSVLRSLENHADPAMVLRALEVGRQDSPKTARRTLTRRAAGRDSVTFRRSPRVFGDAPIGADAGLTEYRPAVAANPARHNLLATAYVAASFPTPETRCLVRRSADRGATWSAPVFLPMLTGRSLCDAPVLTYTPDGRALLAAYRDFKSEVSIINVPGEPSRVRISQKTDVLLSRSEDEGATWSTPVLAIEGDGWGVLRQTVNGQIVILESDPGETLERPSLAAAESGWVYATANRLAQLQPVGDPPTGIVFARSGDAGRTWGARDLVAEGLAGSPEQVVQGGKVVAGAGGEVLVAWYDSGPDGPRQGAFAVRTRRSGDHGASWDDAVDAVVNEMELGLNLGPIPTQKSWWTAMFPDAAVDGAGRAHVVYTHDPEPGSATAEEGDIRHVTSPRPPFVTWSSPATVNDDGPGRAQGFPSIAVRQLFWIPVVEVAWEDCRLAPVENLAYDVFHSRLLGGRRASRARNTRVSDASSTQDGVSTGERTGLAANPGGLVFAVWTDRRDRTATTDGEDDVYGSRIGAW